jgi:hypothetical protein
MPSLRSCKPSFLINMKPFVLIRHDMAQSVCILPGSSGASVLLYDNQTFFRWPTDMISKTWENLCSILSCLSWRDLLFQGLVQQPPRNQCEVVISRLAPLSASTASDVLDSDPPERSKDLQFGSSKMDKHSGSRYSSDSSLFKPGWWCAIPCGYTLCLFTLEYKFLSNLLKC